MKISICEYTTLPYPLSVDISAYRCAGAAGIGLVQFKVEAEPDALSLVRESGLRVSYCVPSRSALLPEPDSGVSCDERVAELRSALELFAPFDPACVYFRLGGAGERDLSEARALACEGLRTIAAAAYDLGIQTAIEIASRREASFITSVAEAADLLVEAGVGPELGLTVDTYHLSAMPGAARDVRHHADRVVGVQIGDRKPDERSPWDRAVPGEGIADLPGWLAVFEEIGFDGWYDIEITSDNGFFRERLSNSLWELPAEELARRAVNGVRAAWAERLAHPAI